MLKSAILTCNDSINYGNRLQNYALSQLLQQYGLTTTIQMYTNADSLWGYVKGPLKVGREKFRGLLYAFGGPKKRALGKRIRRSFKFTKQYVPDNRATLSAYRGLRSRIAFDRVVIGSDQVWNYNWLAPCDLPLRLGSFYDSNKVLSYAASMGVSKLTPEVAPVFNKCLSRIKRISVREIQAADALNEAIHCNAQVVLDPTLMLSRAQWQRFCTSNKAEEPYLITYFLGKPSDKQENVIQQYAKDHHLKIRRLGDDRDLESLAAGPGEFVNLFSKASYVFTDSYHACCFSVIFNVGFKVFNRQGFSGDQVMNSRMETLFALLGIDMDMSDDQTTKIDYTSVNAKLHDWQKRSYDWLQMAMQNPGK